MFFTFAIRSIDNGTFESHTICFIEPGFYKY